MKSKEEREFYKNEIDLWYGGTEYMKSAIFCEHANERPTECKCPENCYCKNHTCKEKEVKYTKAGEELSKRDSEIISKVLKENEGIVMTENELIGNSLKYLKNKKSLLEELQQIIEENPNYYDLGEVITRKYGK